MAPLPIITLPYSSVLLPGAILRIPLEDRKDIQALLAKLTYEAIERSTTPQAPNTTPVPAATPRPASSKEPARPHPIGTVGKVIGFEHGRVVLAVGSPAGLQGGAAILVEGINRFRIRNVLQKTPFVEAEVELLPDSIPDQADVELSSLFSAFQSLASTLLHLLRIPRNSPSSTGAPTHLPAPLARRLQDFIASKPIAAAGRLADFFMAALEPSLPERLQLLQELNVKIRLRRAVAILEKRIEEVKVALGGKLNLRTAPAPPPPPTTQIILRPRSGPPHRPFGGGGMPHDEDADNELNQLVQKLAAAGLPAAAQPVVERELSRLRRMTSVQPEYTVQRTYLETIAEVPWSKMTDDKLNGHSMTRAREVLDRDHYGLEKVKKRVLEYLAVLRLRAMLAQEDAVKEKEKVQEEGTPAPPIQASSTTDSANSTTATSDTPVELTPERERFPSQPKPSANANVITRAPILLFVGPPGTGKTSLAKSIATALGRKFHRISLGGVHSEAEIRGHRRTYIAAMPGVIVNGLRKVGVANPVILLDEIDKVGHRSHNGDPSAALLEVLDPEQNHLFTDHYLSPLTIDLSRIIFIATANSLSEIPPPLLDRMETIHLSAYTNLEKIKIAERYLVPKQVWMNGLKEGQVVLGAEAIRAIVEGYTREPGVRNLEREIATVVRGKAVELVMSRDASGNKPGTREYKPEVEIGDLERILGMARFREEEVREGDSGIGMARRPGIVNGLVAFSTGRGVMSGSGAIIFIEAAVMPGGTQGGLRLTGNLGSVIKESVEVALTWVRAHAYDLGLTHSRDDDLMKNKSIHVHCPAGSDPKDGPSAGVAFIVALVSLFSDRPVPATLAMTGEVSLRGRVTAVGAIKEKLIGALSAGIKTVIVPARNRYDVQELPDEVKRGLDIVCAEHIWDVLKVVWPDWRSIGAHDTLSAIAPISSRL
ncbi:putative LON domain serine protease [Kalaharituber pfeilii]|nr:putative LON domain serine protease [Kalaharituber pfeilii]